MTAPKILQKYWYIIECYLPTDEQQYVNICELLLKAYYTYQNSDSCSFDDYAHSCICAGLQENTRL